MDRVVHTRVHRPILLGLICENFEVTIELERSEANLLSVRSQGPISFQFRLQMPYGKKAKSRARPDVDDIPILDRI